MAIQNNCISTKSWGTRTRLGVVSLYIYFQSSLSLPSRFMHSSHTVLFLWQSVTNYMFNLHPFLHSLFSICLCYFSLIANCIDSVCLKKNIFDGFYTFRIFFLQFHCGLSKRRTSICNSRESD